MAFFLTAFVITSPTSASFIVIMQFYQFIHTITYSLSLSLSVRSYRNQTHAECFTYMSIILQINQTTAEHNNPSKYKTHVQTTTDSLQKMSKTSTDNKNYLQETLQCTSTHQCHWPRLCSHAVQYGILCSTLARVIYTNHTSVNFGGQDTFAIKYMDEKINKMPEFYMTFARKMPKFYMTIARKTFSQFFFFLGGGHMPTRFAPVSDAYGTIL